MSRCKKSGGNSQIDGPSTTRPQTQQSSADGDRTDATDLLTNYCNFIESNERLYNLDVPRQQRWRAMNAIAATGQLLRDLGFPGGIVKPLHDLHLALQDVENGIEHELFEPTPRSPNAPIVSHAEHRASMVLVLCVDCRHVLFKEKIDEACKYVANDIRFDDVFGNAKTQEHWKFLKNRRRDLMRSPTGSRTYGHPDSPINPVYQEVRHEYQNLLKQGTIPDEFPAYYAKAKEQAETALHEVRRHKGLPLPA